MSDTIEELMTSIVEFRDERNWKQFHNAKDLAISISLKAAELLEVFQWSGVDLDANTEKKISKVKEKLADILIYSFLMGDLLGLDISDIINQKIKENNRKYPVDKSFGKADKYTNLK